MTPRRTIPWTETNQQYLVAEFARLKSLLGAKSAEPQEGSAKRIAARMESPPAIDRLVELFRLSDFEREILLLCAGAEMDSELAALCAEARGTQQRPGVTFGLALAVIPGSHWSALTPARPLRQFRLIEVDAGQGITSAPLRIDERVLHYLAGVNALDSRLESLVRLSPSPVWIAAEHKVIATQAAALLAPDPKIFDPQTPGAQAQGIVQLCGDDASGQEDVAAYAAESAGRQLLTVQVEDLPPLGADLDQFAVLWQREALLGPSTLLLQCGASVSASARHLAERLQGPVFLGCREPIRLTRSVARFEVDKPLPTEQKRLWQQALGGAAAGFNGTLDDLSQQFRLSARAIFSTGCAIPSASAPARPADLWAACRSLARPKLEDLAERIVPKATWDDLVLPESQARILRHLAAQVRHRMKVYETWGFSAKGRRGLGVSALFSGASGTGKTLAAQVLAAELGLDLYRIDLSAVVSKYIGETPKNLNQVFDAAEEGGVLLLFDEADALFGKRSDVKESLDRYANIEVGYLLQRMESYQGLAVLTSNLKSAIDPAFQRRLRFTVNFPFPDVTQREAIWQRIFPSQTPTQDIDAKKLAQLNVAGGSIRNIALNAAFLAAQAGEPVRMTHLLNAAGLEALKIERPLSGSEVRGWV
jgi:hypothetical protein